MANDKKVFSKKKKVKSNSAVVKKYGNKFAEKRKGQKPNQYSLQQAEKRKEIGQEAKHNREQKAKKREEEKAQKVN